MAASFRRGEEASVVMGNNYESDFAGRDDEDRRSNVWVVVGRREHDPCRRFVRQLQGRDVLNLLRVGRPDDRPLAGVCFAGCLNRSDGRDEEEGEQRAAAEGADRGAQHVTAPQPRPLSHLGAVRGLIHNPAIRAARAPDPTDTTPLTFRGSWEADAFTTLLRNAIAWGLGA